MSPRSDGGAACQETAGFLFKHPCDRPSEGECADCAKAICERHTHTFGEHTLCTACGRTEVVEGQRRGRRFGLHEEDPYFYGITHYRGYGRFGPGRWGHRALVAGVVHHGASDFTEADGESLAAEGDEAWEEDMGAS